MAGMSEALKAHLASGVTTICRAWAVTRRDGAMLGFTDHDTELSFEGVVFQPETGMTAAALAQSTGLSVDNTEALGALSSEAVTEEDILAGRYDGAEVIAWSVNWADVRQRVMVFRGTLGEISRGDGAFTAELRGLSEVLARETGMVFHPRCSAVLGDKRCGFDTRASGYSAEVALDGGPETLALRDRHVETLGGLYRRYGFNQALKELDGAAAAAPDLPLASSASSRIEACSPCKASSAAARCGVRRLGSRPDRRVWRTRVFTRRPPAGQAGAAPAAPSPGLRSARSRRPYPPG